MQTNICIYLPPPLAQKIDEAARADDRSRSGFIRRALERAVNEVTGETRLRGLERVADAYLSDDNRSIEMPDNNLRDIKQGTRPDKDLANHGSHPVRDIYSPPPRPATERPSDNVMPRSPRPSRG